MKFVGIDLAARPKRTSLCVVDWTSGPRIEELSSGIDDDRICGIAERVAALGIDSPFGWPEPFISFIRHANDRTTAPSFKTAELRMRGTDLWVRSHLADHQPKLPRPVQPLSVSTDKLGSVALRCVHLLERLAARKVARTRIYKVYPAASLAKWCLNGGGSYKRNTDASQEVRRIILQRLVDQGVDVGDFRHQLVTRHDDLDALISALTAALAYADKTVAPPPELADHAKLEGWIHIPRGSLDQLRALQFDQWRTTGRRTQISHPWVASMRPRFVRGKCALRALRVVGRSHPFNEARALCAGNGPSLQPSPYAAREPTLREVVATGPERTCRSARSGESIVLIV